MSRTTIGARPRLISSQSSSRGLDISARPMATICCWPPDSDGAGWSRRSPSIGKQLVDALEIPRPAAAELAADQQIFLDASARETAAALPAPSRCRARPSRAPARRRSARRRSGSLSARRASCRRWICSSVLLPAPLAPITATTSPASTASRRRRAPGSRRSGRRARDLRASRISASAPILRLLDAHVDLADLRAADHLLRRALGDHLAAMQHHDAVDDRDQRMHDMLDPDDRDAGRADVA